MKNQRFYYDGDINAEHGGILYTTNNRQYGYSDVVRITPCSDAGGPSNMYWVQRIVVNVPDDDAKILAVLECHGMNREQLNALSAVARFAALVVMCVSYGGFSDDDGQVIVQIGPDDKYWSGVDRFEPDVRLRDGSSIRAYALHVAHTEHFSKRVES